LLRHLDQQQIRLRQGPAPDVILAALPSIQRPQDCLVIAWGRRVIALAVPLRVQRPFPAPVGRGPMEVNGVVGLDHRSRVIGPELVCAGDEDWRTPLRSAALRIPEVPIRLRHGVSRCAAVGDEYHPLAVRTYRWIEIAEVPAEVETNRI